LAVNQSTLSTWENQMENTTLEVRAVEEAAIQADRSVVVELNDLQLALVGGGIADVIGG
jgi:hypothetical protein